MARSDNLAYAEALLEAALKKAGEVRISQFIEALKESKHLGVTHPTAVSYWEAIRNKPQFINDGYMIRLKKEASTDARAP